MNGDPANPPPPALAQETGALGETLKAIADNDPSAAPADAVAAVFARWLAEAGPISRHPEYFTDVAQNYVAGDHSNRDLHDLFILLAIHLPSPEPEPDHDFLSGTFIGLPMAGR